MGKYIDLKNKIDKLNEKKEIIQLDKQSLVAPLYEIANTYKDRLDRILPKNIDSINSNNLVLRISVLYEEVKEMDLDYVKQKTLLNKIKDVKNEIQKLNEEQDKIDDSMIEIAPELEKRKNYVLEIIDEQDLINKRIDDYRKKINKRLEFLKEDDLEPEIVSSVNNIIKKLNLSIIEEEKKLENILSEDGLSDDMNYFKNNVNSNIYDINNLLTKEDKSILNKRIIEDEKPKEEDNIIEKPEMNKNTYNHEFDNNDKDISIKAEVEDIDNLIELFNRQIYSKNQDTSEFDNYKVSEEEAKLIPKERKETSDKFKNLQFPADSILNFTVEKENENENVANENLNNTIIFKEEKNNNDKDTDLYIKEIADQISKAIASLDKEKESSQPDLKEDTNDIEHNQDNIIDSSRNYVKDIADQISYSISRLDEEDDGEYFYDKKDEEEDKQNLDNNIINSYMDAEYDVVEEHKHNKLIDKIKNIKKFRLSIAIPSIISRFAKVNAQDIISKSKDNFAEARYLLENKLNFFSQEEVNETIDIMKKIKYLKQSVKEKGRYFTRKELNELKKYNKELETYLNYLYSTRNFDEINIRKIR